MMGVAVGVRCGKRGEEWAPVFVGERERLGRQPVTRFFVAGPPQNDMWLKGEEGWG